MICSTADALVLISDQILQNIDELTPLEFQRNGRKYKLVDDEFRRVREEDKHLIIKPEHPEEHTALVSSFSILSLIGDVLTEYPDLCLSIMAVANELERNGWYEVENSSVIHKKYAKYTSSDQNMEALAYFKQSKAAHTQMGINILTSAKINFIHTDHHVGAKLEGKSLRGYIEEYFGEEALNSPQVLVALKSFVHWGNIKGILYRLGLEDIDISADLASKFSNYPEPSQQLREAVRERYPSGTSKYSLARKALITFAESEYAELIPFPFGELYDLEWLFKLCFEIERHPIRYHLRSSSKKLAANPVNLNDLNTKYSAQMKALLSVVSLIANVFDFETTFLLQNSRIPKFDEKLVKENSEYYTQLVAIKEKIDEYEERNWNADDIVSRLRKDNTDTVLRAVNAMRSQFEPQTWHSEAPLSAEFF